MNKDLQLIQTSQLDAISGGDSEFKLELINIFLEQIPEFISNMNLFLKNGNLIQLAREAHTAKSSVLTFGMDETGILLKKIQLLSENKEMEQLPELLSQVNHQFEIAVQDLNKLRNSI
ncbi:MAG: Hpt domain-containing protein [Bacteroidota bacterium]